MISSIFQLMNPGRYIRLFDVVLGDHPTDRAMVPVEYRSDVNLYLAMPISLMVVYLCLLKRSLLRRMKRLHPVDMAKATDFHFLQYFLIEKSQLHRYVGGRAHQKLANLENH